MRGLYLTSPGKTEIRELEMPTPGKGDVLLRVGSVGFCGGDLNGYRGLFPLQEYPVVLGHEIGAIVEAVGVDVPARFVPGMKTTVSPYKSCGVCVACTRGRPNACVDNRTMGVRRPGAMTEFITVPWQDLFPSETLSLEELALAEPLTVGFHAVSRGEVGAGAKVAVIGCGIVGIGAISGAAERGADVIAVDIDDRKLGLAANCGARHTVNSSINDLHQSFQDITGGGGPDVVIEAVGIPATYRAAVEEVGFTGTVVCIGYAKAEVAFETRLFVQKEMTIRGSRNCDKNVDFPAVIRYLEAGSFPVDDVISRRVTLDEAERVLPEWDANPGAVSKIVLSILDDNDKRRRTDQNRQGQHDVRIQ